MKSPVYPVFLLLTLILAACTPTGGDDDIVPSVTTGVLEVDFKLPPVNLPAGSVHRIDLSIARSADSLYRDRFISSANVTDEKSLYRFVLPPGSYYYRAGITCSCLADSCLWGGFPGGRWGARWAVGKVEVKLGQVIRDSPSFQ